MDQRRALVAVVLIFVVLFGYNYWAGQQARQRAALEGDPAAMVAEEATGTTQTDPSAGASTVGSDATTPTSGGLTSDAVGESAVEEAAQETVQESERIITVDTPLWNAQISTHGGDIVSWTLKEYDDAVEGDPVALVPEGMRGLPLAVGYGPETIEARRRSFAYEGPSSIDIGEGSSPATLRFESVGADGVTIVRTYTFDPTSYAFSTTIQAIVPPGPTARRELAIGWPGIEPTEKREEDRAISSTVMIDGGANRQNLGGLKKESRTAAGEIAWVTSQSRYFMAAVAPIDGFFNEAVRFGDEELRTTGFDATMQFDGESVQQTFLVYAGPQDFAGVSSLGIELESAVDLGWRVTRPLSVLMLRALVAVYKVIPNYGLVIILFSILTKLIFYRLTHKSFSEMKRMQDLQPKQKVLQEKYKDDKEGLAKAQMELYKTEKVNPLGGCLPMLLQMPVFIALFQVLRTTIELRGAPFALWITDLSQPDTIATVFGFPIHILPLIMGVGMLVQQKFTSKDPQQAMMGNLMPIVFTALFYNFASGLVLYWSVNTALSIWQQYYIHSGGRKQAEESEPAIVAAEATSTTTAPEFSDAEPAPPTDGPTNGSGKKKGRRKKK